MDLKAWGIFSSLDPKFVPRIKLAYVYDEGDCGLVVTNDDEVFRLRWAASDEEEEEDEEEDEDTDDYEDTDEYEDTDSHSYPYTLSRIKALCGRKVVGFASGKVEEESCSHMLACTEEGALYSWGSNHEGQLGIGSNEDCLVPTLVKNLSSDVVNMACGKHHSLVLTREGNVFAFGSNMNGQIRKSTARTEKLPVRIHIKEKCVAVACGPCSSFAVTDNGQVYSWGCNEDGQLGLGNKRDKVISISHVQFSCCKFEAVFITRVVCGLCHTLALTSIGSVYAWGANECGQLGTGNRKEANSPVLVTGIVGHIVDIAAIPFSNISAAMTVTSKVYMWGECSGKHILSPVATLFSSLHDIFAYIASPRVTWKPIKIEEHASEHLVDSLHQAFDNATHSDLIIKVEGKPIYVHKSILKIRCQHFASMFQEHWQEDKQGEIEISQFSYIAYRAFLQYLYTDKVCCSPKNCLELLQLANAYCETKLMNCCEQIIQQDITVDNAIMLYSTAIKYDAKDLKGSCLQFFLKNMTAIIMSDGFRELIDDTIQDLLRNAINHQAFRT